jgi:DNA-binding CsgD family transcriptional regulator
VRQQTDRALITAVAAWGCGRTREAVDAFAAAAELMREHRLTSLLRGLPHESLRTLAEAARDAGVCDLLPELEAVPTAARCRRYERLTEMELRTLEAVAVHRSIGSTAEALFVTSATVKKHLNAVYRKLQSRGREEAILQATRMGLLSAAPAE